MIQLTTDHSPLTTSYSQLNRKGIILAGSSGTRPEEIAYRKGFVDAAQLEQLATPLIKSGYGNYLMQVLKEKDLPQ